MKPKTRALLERCIASGIAYGHQRAHKHTETPGRQEVEESIDRAIWAEIDEWFDFPEPPA